MQHQRFSAARPRSIIRLAVALVAALGLLVVAAPTSDAKPIKQNADVIQIDSGETVGTVSLKRTPNGLHFNLSTTVGGALYPLPFPGPIDGAFWESGDATTVWFVTFNRPENCASRLCGEGDVFS